MNTTVQHHGLTFHVSTTNPGGFEETLICAVNATGDHSDEIVLVRGQDSQARALAKLLAMPPRDLLRQLVRGSHDGPFTKELAALHATEIAQALRRGEVVALRVPEEV